MTLKFRQDLVGAIVFLVLSSVLWIMLPYQIVIDDDDTITAQTFPRLIIGLMALCSLILLVKELIKLWRKQPVTMVEIHLHQESRAFIIVGLLVLYWTMLHWLPFMVSSIIFSCLFMAFLRCRKWHYYAIVSVVIIAISLFFQNLLNVALP